ncbi:histidinol-phosphate transaminase [Macrococcus equipercicus]|uniref:Histidinol-phosphate aminotransferase n=1 Tax=Macrococcus equipercicus TaxID=69967 RepID=A0A9Q9BMK7_9STAP|nr:histidinol-phosphate transaminase [Macrococcus equipercicus]KAA1042427.1 histidinol-phosphate transaminase [Macrococcus equipercicus]UTH14313.1 histidinol-phosphate transaminase [Macrococcus equipercicus]
MKPQIKQLNVYQPGKTAEELQTELGINGEMMKLSSNENVYGPSPAVQRALQQALKNLHEYPDSSGRALKQTIAAHYDVAEASILLGAGLDEVIMMLSRAILRPGDVILTSDQTFVQYQHHAVIEDCTIVTAPLTDGKFNLTALSAKISADTALIWLCNPNNPTGNYFSEEELTAFLDQAGDIPVVLDEAYAEYVTATDYPDSFALRAAYPNLIILRTFSKAYGLAALRVGYAVSSDDWTYLWHHVKLPFNVTSLSLAAADAALQDQSYLTTVQQRNAVERQRYFASEVSKYLLPSQTNFVLVETEDIKQLNDYLLDASIIARPTPAGVRITIGTAAQNTVVIKALEDYFA